MTLVSARLNSVRNGHHEQFAPFSLDLNIGSDGFLDLLGIVHEGG